MNENSSLIEDADMKFSKLCEIVQDIETKGQDGDHFPRQAVFSSIIASENEIIIQKLEKTLLDEDQSELMRTVIVGLLMQKNIISPICQYADNILTKITIINEEHEGKESLLLLADALIKGTDCEDEDLRNKSCEQLFKLYKVSCHPESSALIADQLLQRFCNILINKNKLIDQNLLQIIKNTEEELNSRVISIEVLSKSQPVEFFNHAKNMVLSINEYSKNNIETMYLLDVLTKYIYNAAVSGIVGNCNEISKTLSDINLENINTDAKSEYGRNNEHLDVIHKRISRRISQLNEMAYSQN